MKYEYGQVVLRDMELKDLVKRRHWEFVDTEWKQWDAPWEYEALDEDGLRRDSERYLDGLRRRIEKEATLADSRFRDSFEIMERVNEHYVGWINSYYLTKDYEWCPTSENAIGLAVGLDLPSKPDRGRGLGRDALLGYLSYLADACYTEAYLQTWSGNYPMTRLAERIGFTEVSRRKHSRQVRGVTYDGLTYRKKL